MNTEQQQYHKAKLLRLRTEHPQAFPPEPAQNHHDELAERYAKLAAAHERLGGRFPKHMALSGRFILGITAA